MVTGGDSSHNERTTFNCLATGAINQPNLQIFEWKISYHSFKNVFKIIESVFCEIDIGFQKQLSTLKGHFTYVG